MQLIILIHGMWGKASDFDYIVDQLRQRGFVTLDDYISGKSESPRGVVYCTRSNEGYFTYDGIDICGLRIANEIVSAYARLKAADAKISELSIVGYSMGGLMARHAIGLLYTRRMFEDVTPKIFITTCTPHVGNNVLGGSMGARIFNALGSWSMARTSRQAFLRDSDPPHKLPLLLALTQQDTPYTRALAMFHRRLVYANAVNDHRCEYYTSAVDSRDPFKNRDLRLLCGPFVHGYEPIVLRSEPPQYESLDDDTDDGCGPDGPIKQGQSSLQRWWIVRKLVRTAKLAYLVVRVGVVLPLWFLAFLTNASYQRTASHFRTRSTLRNGEYSAVDESSDLLESSAEGIVEDMYRTVQDEGKPAPEESEKLPLTPLQAKIIEQFNQLGWEKYILRIIATSKAHSAAVMKFSHRKDFYEGKTAVKHLIAALLDE